MVIRRQQQGQLKVEWEKEAERIMNQKNLTFNDTVNRQLWQVKRANQSTTGKLIDRRTLLYDVVCNPSYTVESRSIIFQGSGENKR
jgi:hypothetical protein